MFTPEVCRVHGEIGRLRATADMSGRPRSGGVERLFLVACQTYGSHRGLLSVRVCAICVCLSKS